MPSRAMYVLIILTAYHYVHMTLIVKDKPKQRIHISIATKDLFTEKAGSTQILALLAHAELVTFWPHPRMKVIGTGNTGVFFSRRTCTGVCVFSPS